MKIDALTPGAVVLAELGERLASIRKQQGYSQEVLAEMAGIGVATLRRIEDGNDSKFGSWIRILKSLRLDASLDALLPENFRSPMAEAKAGGKRRRSPRTPGPGGGPRPSDGTGPSSGTGFTWGDER